MNHILIRVLGLQKLEGQPIDVAGGFESSLLSLRAYKWHRFVTLHILRRQW